MSCTNEYIRRIPVSFLSLYYNGWSITLAYLSFNIRMLKLVAPAGILLNGLLKLFSWTEKKWKTCICKLIKKAKDLFGTLLLQAFTILEKSLP